MIMARAAWGALALALALVAAVAAAAAVAIWRARAARGSVAFLHPFTNHGGGGERVLWVAVAALMRARPEADVAVYSGDGLTGEQLATRAVERFGVRVPRAPRVVPLQTRALVEDRWYPVATVLGQSLGSMLMTLEALCRLCPDVFIDTAGYAFGYPLAAAAGCSVCAYVHYPTVSSDMIARVRARAGIYNNRGALARTALGTHAKLAYYSLLTSAYGACGRRAHAVAANSSWTRAHIEALWSGGRSRGGVRLVYPPCDTAALAALPAARPRERLVLSVAQFRPEKDQPLQVRAFAAALRRARDAGVQDTHAWWLAVAGATRNEGDARRAREVRALSEELGVAEQVQVLADVPLEELRDLLRRAAAGLHTMLDEHFGISVVDFMAAAIIPIAHDSAGPRQDIVGEGSEAGFLARTEEEYADAIARVLTMAPREYSRVAAEARVRSARFSEAGFEGAFLAWLVDEGVLPATCGGTRTPC